MPRINVRDVPRPLHALLKRRAAKNHRSLNKEVLAILKSVAGTDSEKRQAAIERINKRRRDGPTIQEAPDEIKRIAREGLM